MKIFPDDPIGIVSLTAADLLYTDYWKLEKAPYYLRQPCQVSVTAEVAMAAFLYCVTNLREKQPKETLAQYYRGLCNTRHQYSLEFIDAETVQFVDQANGLVWHRKVSFLWAVVMSIATRVAQALNGRMEACKLIMPRGSQPFFSVKLSPA